MKHSKTLSIGIYLSNIQGLTAEMLQELLHLAVYGNYHNYHYEELDDFMLYKVMRIDNDTAARLADRAEEAGLSIARYTAARINYLLQRGVK